MTSWSDSQLFPIAVSYCSSPVFSSFKAEWTVFISTLQVSKALLISSPEQDSSLTLVLGSWVAVGRMTGLSPCSAQSQAVCRSWGRSSVLRCLLTDDAHHFPVPSDLMDVSVTGRGYGWFPWGGIWLHCPPPPSLRSLLRTAVVLHELISKLSGASDAFS